MAKLFIAFLAIWAGVQASKMDVAVASLGDVQVEIKRLQKLPENMPDDFEQINKLLHEADERLNDDEVKKHVGAYIMGPVIDFTMSQVEQIFIIHGHSNPALILAHALISAIKKFIQDGLHLDVFATQLLECCAVATISTHGDQFTEQAYVLVRQVKIFWTMRMNWYHRDAMTPRGIATRALENILDLILEAGLHTGSNGFLLTLSKYSLVKLFELFKSNATGESIANCLITAIERHSFPYTDHTKTPGFPEPIINGNKCSASSILIEATEGIVNTLEKKESLNPHLQIIKSSMTIIMENEHRPSIKQVLEAKRHMIQSIMAIQRMLTTP